MTNTLYSRQKWLIYWGADWKRFRIYIWVLSLDEILRCVNDILLRINTSRICVVGSEPLRDMGIMIYL